MNDKEPKSAPVEETLRVYNRSTRQTFNHEVTVGKDVKKYSASPSSFATVPVAVAQIWMRLFPEVVIEAGVAQRELGGASAELAVVRGELAIAKTRIAELEKENLKLKAAAQV